ncbi:MAG: hypothetical protein RL662_1279 [Bacteroidota bacterium]|jgi:hypothetical protein
MKIKSKLLLLISTSLLFPNLLFSQKKTAEITVVNNGNVPLVDYTLEIPLHSLNLVLGSYVAMFNNQVVPVELSEDIEGNVNAIIHINKLQAKDKFKIQIQQGTAPTYPKRTYAELSHKIGGQFEGTEYKGGFAWVKPNYLRVPHGMRDHAYYVKYEGPGWESDKVGFRFYLDWRNAIDVFGKKTPHIVLPTVGVDGYDNYHKMADWGMDNMKVGKALGLGSIAIWDGTKAVRVEKTDSTICYIKADGKIRSQVMTTYYGWDANGAKTNLKSLISIDGGSRASYMQLAVDNPISNIATGINKSKDVEFFISDATTGKWAYIASFGKQSLNNDMMGLAVFYRKAQLQKITEDSINHVLVLSPTNGKVDYYFMPTWEQDWEPVKTKVDFQRCIDEVLNRLNSNVTISLK